MSSRHYYYILSADGQPIPAPTMRWAMWLETADRTVARTEIGEAEVSTVFLSLDHNFSGKGAPVLYETLVFGGQLDGEMTRYTTHEEALAGHSCMVARVKEAEQKGDDK